MKSLTQQHLKKHPEKLARFDQVVIWSGEHQAWWREGGSGYTDKIEEAGIWAAQIAWKRILHCGPEKRIALHEAPKKCAHCGKCPPIRIRIPKHKKRRRKERRPRHKFLS
jgi:hypothetical protein